VVRCCCGALLLLIEHASVELLDCSTQGLLFCRKSGYFILGLLGKVFAVAEECLEPKSKVRHRRSPG